MVRGTASATTPSTPRSLPADLNPDRYKNHSITLLGAEETSQNSFTLIIQILAINHNNCQKFAMWPVLDSVSNLD